MKKKKKGWNVEKWPPFSIWEGSLFFGSCFKGAYHSCVLLFMLSSKYVSNPLLFRVGGVGYSSLPSSHSFILFYFIFFEPRSSFTFVSTPMIRCQIIFKIRLVSLRHRRNYDNNLWITGKYIVKPKQNLWKVKHN